jgi:hypothetical protein
MLGLGGKAVQAGFTPRERLEASVTHYGNRVNVRLGTDQFFYEVEGIDLPPIVDHSFLLWHLAAYGLEMRYDVHLAGRVDPVVLANVRRMVRTWAMWQPGNLPRINVTVDEEVVPTAAGTSETATVFSGGLDATYMLLRRGRLKHPGTAVTMQGMDYELAPGDQFKELLAKTAPLLEHLNYRQVVIRSDATRKLSYNFHSYAMAIAGNVWLLSGLFGGAEMAADFSLEQDLITFPWAGNGVTSRYYEGSSFRMETRDLDVTRAEKAAIVATDPIALNSVAFCSNERVRPKNCGKCMKCLRTKAMFVVTIGEVPDIFIDRSFDPDAWSKIELNDSNEVAFFLDIYETARDKGSVPPELQAAYEARFPVQSMYRDRWPKDWVRRILGRPPKMKWRRPIDLRRQQR